MSATAEAILAGILLFVFGLFAVWTTVAAAHARGRWRTRHQQGLTEQECREQAAPVNPHVRRHEQP